ncbi:hypothetical protein [Candidatus Poriferisodalis sp.]|uniref:hypothetical protein n=1 Tax=Candidatus Poriferisodalis sp. TaxID=3101277 RepID=UPI003B022C80
MPTNETAGRRREWGRWALLWFVPLYVAARIIDPGPLAILLAAVSILGALALLPDRNGRERATAVLATAAVLAVGLLALRLLSAGWALAAILALTAAAMTALLGWHKRRMSGGRPDRPEASPAARTPAERRAATEARWAQGAEAARRERAEQAAEYERAAEQRRREAAERREAEAAGS